MAEASGLSLVAPDQRDPVASSTFGTGQLLAAAVEAGAERIVLGIGGSATTDGGRGALLALGGRPNSDLPDAPWDLRGIPATLEGVALEVASDVSNPLLGPQGAAAVYGPQKGATPDLVTQLDERNARWADVLEAAAGRRVRDVPGAGAAGGLGFALLALQDRFHSFALRPGVDLVMEATGFAAKLARADVVLTGEGRIDESTAFGKTALGVARRAHLAGHRCIAISGGVTRAGADSLREVGAVAVPIVEAPMSLEEAIGLGAAPVEAAGERIAALVTVGQEAR
jgi:glycerate kinase